jgi:hypothetical protein
MSAGCEDPRLVQFELKRQRSALSDQPSRSSSSQVSMALVGYNDRNVARATGEAELEGDPQRPSGGTRHPGFYRRSREHRFEDVRIGSAAAVIAGHRTRDDVKRRRPNSVERRADLNHHPGRAETALQSPVFNKSSLTRNSARSVAAFGSSYASTIAMALPPPAGLAVTVLGLQPGTLATRP